MKFKIIAVIVATVALFCFGCAEEKKTDEKEIQTLKKSIQFLNSNKECLEESVSRLNKQLTATKFQIKSLEGQLNALIQPEHEKGFWEAITWSNWQVNFVLLLLFVLWLLYRTQLRQKK